MAEPPSSERRPPRPPPVPGRRKETPPPVPHVNSKSTGSSNRAETGAVVGARGTSPGDDDGETRPVQVPDRAQLIEEISASLAAEAEALLVGGVGNTADDAVGDIKKSNADELLVDINIRLALFSWDVLEDAEMSLRYMEMADSHPLAADLMLAHSLSSDLGRARERVEDAQGLLDRAQGLLDRKPAREGPDAERAAMQLELAEAWLYRFGDAGRAADAALTGLGCLNEASDETTNSRAADVDAGASIGDKAALVTLSSELSFVRYLALAVHEEWNELAAALTAVASTPEATSGQIREALHVIFDRLDDGDAASALLADVDPLGTADSSRVAALIEQARSGGVDVSNFGLNGLALEVARAAGDEPAARVALLRRRFELCSRESASEREGAATRYLLADDLRDAGDARAAAAELDALAAADGGGEGAWGPRLARLRRWLLAADDSDWGNVVESLRQLAVRKGGGAYSIMYVRRAAEILDARVNDVDRALDLWRKVLSKLQADQHAQRSAERLLLQRGLDGDATDLIRHLKAQGKNDSDRRAAALRRASAVAESRGGDIAEALRLRQASLDTEDEHGGVAGQVALVRLYRSSRDRAKQAEAYRAVADGFARSTQGERADSEADSANGNTNEMRRRCASVALCAAGALDLSRGQLREAEEALVRAANLAPHDPAARLALASLYRRARRWDDLVTTLFELVDSLVGASGKSAALREIGTVCSQRLNDGARARKALEQALEISPDDGDTLRAVALLCDAEGDWDKSVELRARAADDLERRAGDERVEAQDGNESAANALALEQARIQMEIGSIEAEKRGDSSAAIVAYQSACELVSADDAHGEEGAQIRTEALHAQAELHRRTGDHTALLGVLANELEHNPAPSRRGEIQLEIASVTAAESGDPAAADAAMAAYLDVLSIDPENARALSGVEALASTHLRWDDLAQAFRKAPKNERNLDILARALEELGQWKEYIEARIAQLELGVSASGEPGRDGGRAQHIAETCETRLENPDRAIEFYMRALELQAGSRKAQQELSRLLEAGGRWTDLALAYENELTTVAVDDHERQIGLLLRLGRLRREELGKVPEAALAFESVLELQPHHVPALQALQELYTSLDREKDLLRVLAARASATDDMIERSDLYVRAAELRDRRGDADGALADYSASFNANPSNRDTFTAMEKLCYQHERWTDVMSLYDGAITLVEEGTSRAYRLGDLYARRGQVQLQYLHELGEAAASYLRVIELDPENDTAVKFLESIFSQQGDWVGLIAAYEKRASLARDDDRRLDTLRRAARVAGAKLKDPAEAARVYELILQVDSSDREALDALERFHDRNGDWDALVKVLKARLSSAPAGDAATALLKRIAQICEEGLRDEQRAIEHYLRILEIAPGNKEALEALGRIYESTEQWAEFIDVTRRQIRITTERNVKALLYFKCGSVMEAKFSKEEDAIRYYDAAIKTSPSCLPAVHGLRDLYRRRKDWPRVIQTLELEVKLWQDDKERAGVFAQIGRIYADQLDQPERAMHYYESALAVDPECLPGNRALFEHYFERQDWERAQPLAQALAQKAMREGDPTQRSEFYRRRGIVARMTGQMRAAAESLVISLEIRPTNLESLDALGELAKVEPYSYDFQATYRELEKIYKKRDDSAPYMARVRVAAAVMKEREGDLDSAEELYAEAYELAPSDFAIMSALVDLHANMRRWTHAVDAIVRFLNTSAEAAATDVALGKNSSGAKSGDHVALRARALMRQAEIHADCEMDSHRAVSVLKEIIKLQPNDEEAPYRLSQELFLLGRFGEAKQAVERAIQLAAAPGKEVKAEVLARYYYYLGRIIEGSGDARGAVSQYRRAAEYDPGYGPPVLSLAKRAADSGDQRQAETLLINAAHAAMESGGAQAAVPLQRGLARILLASGDRPAAIEAYRGILAVEPDGAVDRVALAEIYAVDDLAKATNELKKVVERDIRHAPAYRLLASFYSRTQENARADRVLAAMELLGFADAQGAPARTEKVRLPPLRRPLDEELRTQLLLSPGSGDAVGQLYAAIAPQVAALFPQPHMGENLMPIQTIDDPALKVALADMTRLYGIEPEVYLGENVPRAMVAVAHPRKLLVIDRSLLTEVDAARRFLLGYAFDGIRSGYALLFHLGKRQRGELASLLNALLQPESERAGPTADFIASLPKQAIKLIDSLAGSSNTADPEDWIDDILATAKRAGLFVCDDFDAATRMIGRLGGEQLSVGADAVGLGAVLGGHDLVRFFLSDGYHRLRETLSQPPPVPGGMPAEV